jgi:hypothetical protein
LLLKTNTIKNIKIRNKLQKIKYILKKKLDIRNLLEQCEEKMSQKFIYFFLILILKKQ